MFGLDKVRDEVIVPVRGIRDPEERLRQLILRHARITTRGHGAVAHLGDEIRALPPAARRQIEQRMRVYFDLVRDTLAELQAAGRLRDVDPTVATFSLIGMILWLPRWFRQDGRLTQERSRRDRRRWRSAASCAGAARENRHRTAKLTRRSPTSRNDSRNSRHSRYRCRSCAARSLPCPPSSARRRESPRRFRRRCDP